jgi:hypothetical protein
MIITSGLQAGKRIARLGVHGPPEAPSAGGHVIEKTRSLPVRNPLRHQTARDAASVACGPVHRQSNSDGFASWCIAAVTCHKSSA